MDLSKTEEAANLRRVLVQETAVLMHQRAAEEICTAIVALVEKSKEGPTE